MIRLEKREKPAILADNERIWTDTLARKAANGDDITETEKTRYRHPQIKAALIEETYGKCAYCESKLLHIAFGDVEHISPKSKSITSLFKWENLTLACDKCNTFKGNVEGIVDPYSDDPATLFAFLGPAVIPHTDQERALHTERVLHLNRMDLVERRYEKIKYLSGQLMVLEKVTDPDLVETLKKDLLSNETGSYQEFAATARSFLAAMLPPIIARKNPEPDQE